MELWLEYLIRKKLEKFIPVERKLSVQPHQVTVRRSYYSDWQVWMYFLSTYRPIIRIFCPRLSENCRQWSQDWIKGRGQIPMSEQKSKLFRAMPHLEEVWSKWTETILRSNVSLPEITV
jgi:hypothetical protein